MPEFKDLKFVRITQPNIFSLVLPQHLFEQVEGRSWCVERLYKYAPLLLINPATYLWVLVDDSKATKGVLWVTIDALSEKLNVIVFSVDEEYQNDGNIESVLDFLRQFIKDFNETGAKNDIELKEKINWITSQPEVLEKIGGQRSKTVIIEV